MRPSYLFYDVETSGLGRRGRIVHFAARRTDHELRTIGEPIDVRVALPVDVVPEPGSLAVHGLSLEEMRQGISEPALARMLVEKVFVPGTVAVGYNNVGFDNETVRHALWRSFHSPYRWQSWDERGTWDCKRMALMFRALRPSGVVWPEVDGEPVNDLVSLAERNGIEHVRAHDAASDVEATIGLARLLRAADAGLFDHFVAHRHKTAVRRVLESRELPLVTLNRGFGPLSTALVKAYPIEGDRWVVCDLSADLESIAGRSDEALAEALFPEYLPDSEPARRPVQILKTNRNPGIVGSSILAGDEATVRRLGIDRATVREGLDALARSPDLAERVRRVADAREFDEPEDVDERLYARFPDDADESAASRIREAEFEALSGLRPTFADDRMDELWLRYRGRYAPEALSESERVRWQTHLRSVTRVSPEYWEEWDATYAGADAGLRVRLEELKAWVEGLGRS